MSIWKDDLNNRKKNIKILLTDPRTRPIVFITCAVILGMIIVGYMSLVGAKSDSGVDASANIATRPTEVRPDPSSSSSSAHQRLLEEADRQALEQARRNQQSSLPTLRGNDGISDPLSLPAMPSSTQPTEPKPAPPLDLPQMPAPTYAPPPQYAPPQYAAPAPVQQAPVARPKADQNVSNQVMGYMAMWGPNVLSEQEFSYAGKATPEDFEQRYGNAQTNAQASQVAPTAPQTRSAIRFVRAGTVIPARMLTPLTSDNPGPVLAEVSSGPLKGARLLGTMQVQKEGILVTFNSISKPGWPDTYRISAVGMTNDGYTGMATDVNKHYLQRYTALLAGTFMGGYGQGLSQSGSTTIITDGGAVVSTQDELDSRQIRNRGYGRVAQAIGSELASAANRETTIEVKPKDGQMYDFQVLFLENF